MLDRRARWAEGTVDWFAATLWRQAERDLARCGIRLDTLRMPGEVRRTPGGRPLFTGLARNVLNVVVTDQIPLSWDAGRCLAGVATVYEGYHICAIALNHAHPHRIPILAVNTCVHEILHALLLDIFEPAPKGWRQAAREFRIDAAATTLWLFRSGGGLRDSARTYVQRLQKRSR